jgi:hypothetical protein
MVCRNYRHDRGLDWIVHRLNHGIISNSEDLGPIHIDVEKPFGYNGQGIIGEIDVFAMFGDRRIMIFEYKCHSDNKQRNKAYQQLFLAKRYYEHLDLADIVSTFYVHDENKIEHLVIKEIDRNKDGFRFSIDRYGDDRSTVIRTVKPYGFKDGYFFD